MKRYDVAIIGGGIGGLMAAYRLISKNPDKKVIIIEKGNALNSRKCPASSKQGCVHCKMCSITSGYAGAGAFSDGKFNLGTAYGGKLGEELGEEVANEYIGYVDEILYSCSDIITDEFGNESRDYPPIYESNQELKLKCLQNNLRLLDMNVRHLGTDRNMRIMGNLIHFLAINGVELTTGCEVESVEKIYGNGGNYLVHINDVSYGDYVIETDYIVVATGRGGSKFVSSLCKDFDVDVHSNTVDIGVRVEMKDAIWRGFSDHIYEPKVLYKTKTFEDRTRMFCFNKGGLVSAENNNGVITANGHSFSDDTKRTENCNFAILSSINFTAPFDKPTEYVESISRLANEIGCGNVIVQRFGDLIRGRRTNEHRLSQNTVFPTLKATPGDISLVLPHRILTNIIETIYALDKVAPGTANDDTLLYGCEAKYYSIKPCHDEHFRITDGIYLIGDGSGITRGLSQAGAMGIYVADHILSL